jgi:hypothetical protein
MGEMIAERIWHKYMPLTVWMLGIFCCLNCVAASESEAQILGTESTTVAQGVALREPIITLERFRSCRSCPGYQVNIFEDGAVTYLGKEFVNVKGYQYAQLSLSQLKSLLTVADSLQIETMADTYMEPWVDASVVSVGYKPKSAMKSVRFQPVVGKGPPALDKFADLIDSTVDTFRWICPVPQFNELVCKRV